MTMSEHLSESEYQEAAQHLREAAAENPWPIDDRPLLIAGENDRITMSNYGEARMAAAQTIQTAAAEGEAYPGQAGMAATLLAVIADFNELITAARTAFEEVEKTNQEGKGTHHG